MSYRQRREVRKTNLSYISVQPLVPYTVDNSAGGNYVLLNFGQAVNVTSIPSIIWVDGSGTNRPLVSHVVNSQTQVRLNFATAVADTPGFMQLTANQPQIRSGTGAYVDPVLKFVPVEA